MWGSWGVYITRTCYPDVSNPTGNLNVHHDCHFPFSDPLSTKNPTLAIRNRIFVTKNKQEVGDMHPKTRQILRDLYSSFNKQLVKLLGEDRWNKWIY